MSIPILTPTLRSAKKSSSPNGRDAHNFAIAASRSSSLRLTGETWSGLLGKQGIRHRSFCPPRVNISVGQTFRPGARQDGGSFAAQNLGADLSRNHLDMLPGHSIFAAFRIGIGSRLRSTIMKSYSGILETIGGPAWVLVLEDRQQLIPAPVAWSAIRAGFGSSFPFFRGQLPPPVSVVPYMLAK